MHIYYCEKNQVNFPLMISIWEYRDWMAEKANSSLNKPPGACPSVSYQHCNDIYSMSEQWKDKIFSWQLKMQGEVILYWKHFCKHWMKQSIKILCSSLSKMVVFFQNHYVFQRREIWFWPRYSSRHMEPSWFEDVCHKSKVLRGTAQANGFKNKRATFLNHCWLTNLTTGK